MVALASPVLEVALGGSVQRPQHKMAEEEAVRLEEGEAVENRTNEVMWSSAETPITIEAGAPVTIFGEPNATYGIQVDYRQPQPVVIGIDGILAFELGAGVEPGFHEICLLVSEDADSTLSEAANCHSFAVLP